MGFFGRDEDSEQSEVLARIEAGGIPPRAEERLRALGSGSRLFTSALSVNEFALLDQLGPRPVAQVMGASVIRTGWQYLPPLSPGVSVTSWYGGRGAGLGPTVIGPALQNPFTDASPSQLRAFRWHEQVVCRLDVLTNAWDMARQRAIDRLREEARQVGAEAVVGVHLHRSDRDLGKGTIEYVVRGTAIRLPEPAPTGTPLLSHLSVQDYWRLHVRGHEPVGLVAAAAVVFASPPAATRLRRARTISRNQELDELSSAFRTARETIRERLRGQALDVHAWGVVGVEITHSVHREKFALESSLSTESRRGWHRGRLGLPYRVSGRGDVERRGWVITMHAAGTAVRKRDAAPERAIKTSLRLGTP